jgi:hypothetical protein
MHIVHDGCPSLFQTQALPLIELCIVWMRSATTLELTLTSCAVLELAPGIAALTGLTAIHLNCPSAVPASLVAALGDAGRHLARVTMSAAFLRADDAEAFATNVLPQTQGLTRLDIHVGAAGKDAICAVGRAAGRLPMLRELSLTFPRDLPLGHTGQHRAFNSAGIDFAGCSARNAAAAASMLPLLTVATTLERLTLVNVQLSAAQEAEAALNLRALPRLRKLSGMWIDHGPTDLYHLSLDIGYGQFEPDVM